MEGWEGDSQLRVLECGKGWAVAAECAHMSVSVPGDGSSPLQFCQVWSQTGCQDSNYYTASRGGVTIQEDSVDGGRSFPWGVERVGVRMLFFTEKVLCLGVFV